jgi:hypothetical protein
VEERQDSDFGSRDTGIKLFILYVMSSKAKEGGDQGSITVTEIKKVSNRKVIELKPNTLVMFNSRAYKYSIY